MGIKIYYENAFFSGTLQNNESGIKNGEYSLLGHANEKNMLIEGAYSDYCLVTCENDDEDLEYRLQYVDVPKLKNVTVDNESAEWIEAGGYNWSEVYGWPLYATYSDGSKQHIWGSRYYCNTEGKHDGNMYIGHDDYGNCFLVEQTTDSEMFDADNLLLEGTYPVKIMVGEQVFEDELMVKAGGSTDFGEPYTPTESTSQTTPGEEIRLGESISVQGGVYYPFIPEKSGYFTFSGECISGEVYSEDMILLEKSQGFYGGKVELTMHFEVGQTYYLIFSSSTYILSTEYVGIMDGEIIEIDTNGEKVSKYFIIEPEVSGLYCFSTSNSSVNCGLDDITTSKRIDFGQKKLVFEAVAGHRYKVETYISNGYSSIESYRVQLEVLERANTEWNGNVATAFF